MGTNGKTATIWLNRGFYGAERGHWDSEPVEVRLPRNWSVEHDGCGGRRLLDSHGNERQILTVYGRYGRPMPEAIDGYGVREELALVA